MARTVHVLLYTFTHNNIIAYGQFILKFRLWIDLRWPGEGGREEGDVAMCEPNRGQARITFLQSHDNHMSSICLSACTVKT